MENHRVYSQLLTSKRKIEAVVLSISDGVIVTDGELNVVITNSLADQLLGVPRRTTSQRPAAAATASPTTALIRQLEDCLATGKSTRPMWILLLGREERTYQAVVHPMRRG